MTKKIMLIVLLIVAIMPVATVSAQDAPHVVSTTMPVDAEIREAVDAWLQTSAPVPVPYYGITYAEYNGLETFVSVVALNITDPNAKWRMTDSDDVAWMGSILIAEDGGVQPVTPQEDLGGGLYSPVPAGGGQSVRFPWASGGTMMYGPRGVHAAGGGGSYATGFMAVDFVGGDDMGSGVARPQVYAVADGTVDYVCADATTTLIRTTGGGHSYIYAHLLDNANLVASHAFTRGQLIGTLKYGSFDDTCGWAEQTDKHYHLHFGFQFANNAFRLENCILSSSTKKWTCGTQTISTGQFLLGGGGVSTGGDDPANTVSQPSFWDYVLSGVVTVWDKTVIAAMPSHTALKFTSVLYSTVKVFLRMARVLIYSNINLGPLMAVVFLGFTIKVLFGVAEFIVFLFKAWKSLVPVLGA